MTDHSSRNWVDIHLERLSANLGALREHLPQGCKVMAVVKANAYGHGDGFVSRYLANAGVDWLAVSNVEEAVALRRQGVICPILVLIGSPVSMIGDLSEYNLTQTVFSAEYGAILEEAARESDARLPIHIKVDTGMTRLGFHTDQISEIEALARSPYFEAQGIYTHFSSADEAGTEDESYTRLQFSRFMELLGALEKRGITFPLRHCSNSGASLLYPEMALDMVRPGIMLYGLCPSEDCEGIIPLQQVMEWRAVVSMVKTVPAGVPVSYGRQFITPHEMRLATVPVGYADGYGREQFAGGWLLIRGEKAPIVGRICMDQLMVDVTHIPRARAGDIAGLAGMPGGATFREMAARASTITYEKICAVGRRVPRIYRKNGEVAGISSDLGY